MNTELRNLLLSGPHTAKQVAEALGKSQTWARDNLKKHAAEIRCRKDQGQNLFWIEADDGFEATPDELAAQTTRQDVQAERAEETQADTPQAPPADPIPAAVGDGDTCPLCHAEAEQVQAGPDGTYLGAARRCSACSRTYNVHSKEEVIMAKEQTEKKKRAPLNPQYKINAKIKAAEAAGGKLKYEREGKTWVLTKKGMDPKRMTAVEFSNETPETITAALTA